MIASMSVSAPAFRLAEDRVEKVVSLLLAATDEVSRRLGRSKL